MTEFKGKKKEKNAVNTENKGRRHNGQGCSCCTWNFPANRWPEGGSMAIAGIDVIPRRLISLGVCASHEIKHGLAVCLPLELP